MNKESELFPTFSTCSNESLPTEQWIEQMNKALKIIKEADQRCTERERNLFKHYGGNYKTHTLLISREQFGFVDESFKKVKSSIYVSPGFIIFIKDEYIELPNHFNYTNMMKLDSNKLGGM